YVDPSFRAHVEEIIPYSKEFFGRTIGGSSLEQTKQQMSELKDRVMRVIPQPKRKSEEVEKPLLKITPLPPIPKSSQPNAVVEPVDVTAIPEEIRPHGVISSELRAKKNKELESSLKAALASSTIKVQAATDAKVATIAAINEHSALMKKNVDDAQHADWEEVAKALERVEKLSRTDSADEIDARNYLDNVRKVVSEGRACDVTRDNPLLANATETVNKLGQQLDELNVLVQRARSESRIMNQYKDLIEKSRRQFAQELKSILPNVDIHAKDSKLTEDELNALIAHAHLRVDQLKRQLTEQQIREEENIARAVEQQRIADDQFAERRLQLEMQRMQQQSDVDIERKVVDNRRVWEMELEERLQRAAVAHSEHLEQVLRTQRQLYDIEQSQRIEEAIAQERSLHSRQIGIAQAKLDGLEAALNSRVAADVENRRSKQFWIACQNLVDSIVYGRKGGIDIEARRKPLASELQVIKEASNGDEFVSCLLEALPNDAIYNGVYTEQDLKTRFHHLYRAARRVAKVDEGGAGLTGYLISTLRSAVTLDLPRKFSLDDKVDMKSLDNYEILARTMWLVDNDHLENAVRMVQLLKGEPQLLARDWVVDTRNYLQARLIAGLLVTHAAATNIRSIY
uniref:MICOS complex subunit MIC60 n=1 Tax=Parascaris univalens TaxID=6257 RepID=A0A915C4D4_PARUN